MNIVVIDDKNEDLERYASGIKEHFRNKIESLNVYTYNKAADAREKMKDYDVLFLDVQMPQQDGVSFAKELRKEHIDIIIIFLSDYDSYVWDSFDVEAVCFMRKRYFFDEIEAISKKVINLYKQREKKKIVIEDGKNIYPFIVDELMYIEAQGKYIKIVTTTKEYTIKKKISMIEKELTGLKFIKTHRSYLVNYRYVKKIEPLFVQLDNEVEIPVSKYRSDAIRNQYLECLGDI